MDRRKESEMNHKIYEMEMQLVAYQKTEERSVGKTLTYSVSNFLVQNDITSYKKAKTGYANVQRLLKEQESPDNEEAFSFDTRG